MYLNFGYRFPDPAIAVSGFGPHTEIGTVPRSRLGESRATAVPGADEGTPKYIIVKK